MKKIILLLVTVICGISLFSQNTQNQFGIYEPELIKVEPQKSRKTQNGFGVYESELFNLEPQKSNVLNDGTYKAVVEYKNSYTSHAAKYSLTVNVVDDRVVQINFDNGGFINYRSRNIHSYSGGNLSFSTNYSGEITGASTTVIVKESYTTTITYKISL